MRAGGALGEGAGAFCAWRERIEHEGIESLFQTAPHALKLRRVGLGDDITFCAQVDITTAVPRAVLRHPLGVILRDGR
jgi:phosphosulfolactate phosphohydrolase-like enzyme